MFEYKDNFLMGPVRGLFNGDDNYPFCTISNAAEEELAELAKLVGDGQTLRPAGEAPSAPLAVPQEVTPDWTQATEATAPNLNYDLEEELSRAFGTSEPQAPVEQVVETISAETAVVAAVDAPTMAFDQEPQADFSNGMADELERALAEEAAAEAALDAAMEAEFAASISPQADVTAEDAIAAELNQLANGTVEAHAQPDVPMPVATEQTLDPWTTPEIVEPTVEATPALAMPEVTPEAEWAAQPFDAENFSDPAAERAVVAQQPQAAHSHIAETAAVAAGAGAGAAVASSVHHAQAAPAQPVQPAYTVPAEDEVMVPPPHMYDRSSGGGAGKRIALAVVAVALMGGVAAAGWNMFDGSDGLAPTILAATEPAKVKPKDTGGKIVPNQDQAVYRSVGGETAAPKQAKLKDTSETPIKVAAKATPSKTVTRASAEGAKAETGVKVQPRRVRTVVVKPDGTIVSTVGKAAEKPLTVAAASVVEPTLALKPELVAADASVETATPAASITQPILPAAKKAAPVPKKAVVQKVAVKKVPVKKVVAKKVPVKKVAVKKAPVKKAEPIKTASVSSPFAVQISSQRSAAAAQKSYATLSRRYASVIGGKGVDIRKAVIKGKGTYYRVRIPANSRSAANTICSGLKAQGGACFVTR